MSLVLHNTATRTKEPFHPLREGKVLMYNCGPTVYSRAHIGNLASYLFSDVLRRWLEVSGYTVRQVKNITDVGHLTEDDLDRGEDKLVRAATSGNTTVEAIAKLYTDHYIRDEEALNLLEPTARPRATAFIAQQISMVEALLERGHAYEVEGNVYFSIETFPAYGALSGNTVEALSAGERVDVDTNKRHPADFLLWRKAAPEHVMQWDSPWGRGYPGWHIECSAMAHELLGEQIDIHTGGEDNIFPHHESEIAQSEALSGKPFSRFWLHRRHILVDGEKMSKSKGNVYTLSDIEKEGFHPLDFRFLVFGSHYRQKMDFSWEALRQAREGLRRLLAFRERLLSAADAYGTDETSFAQHAVTNAAHVALTDALNDDLNTPEALAQLYGFVREGNGLLDASPDPSFIAASLDLLSWIDRILGVLEAYPTSGFVSELSPDEIASRIQEREQARADRDFSRADAIRDELANKGVELIDTDTRTEWRLR